MKKTVLLLLLVALFGVGAWWVRHRPTAPAPAPVASTEPAVVEFAAADLLTVAPVTLARSIPVTGSLKPLNQTIIKTKVAGDLRDLTVREGDAVRKGQVLGHIDVLEYQVRVSERQAQLAAADSQVAQARRTLENNVQLRERNFISQSALDAARSSWEVAIGNRDAAAAQLALARKSLGDAALMSPLSGVVAERFAQPGEKLPVDGRVLSIVDLSRMEIEAAVPAANIGSVKIGQTVALSVEGVPTRQTGRIARIAPGTQAGTRSVPVFITLENRDPAVRAGLFAQGQLTVESRQGVIAVPASAIREAGARTFVYSVADGKLLEREVQTGLRDDSDPGRELIEITRGLSAGDRIVAANLGRLRAGSPVRIREATPGNAPATPAPATPVPAASQAR